MLFPIPMDLSWTKNRLRMPKPRGYDSIRCQKQIHLNRIQVSSLSGLTSGFEEEERQLAAVWAHMKMCAFFLWVVNEARHLPAIH